MRFRELDLNLLVVLDALLTDTNVSRAAERLHLTQPAISNSLSRLRRHFHDDLLLKRGRRMVPTPLANSLRTPVRDALLQFQTIADTRPNFNPASATHRFIIVASDYVAATLLAEAVMRLQTEAPGITIVSHQLTERNLEHFHHGDWDLLIAPKLPAISGHHTRLLFRERFTCIASASNTTIGDTLTLKQYLAARHVIASFDDPNLMAFDEAFLTSRGHKRQVAAAVSNFTLLPLFVVGTDHIATIHSRLARRFAKTIPIRIVRPHVAFPYVEELLHWHRHRDRDPASLWLRNFLIDVASTLPQS
jgi:LysR family transcriptional regulator, nod-box dependent transcriptional activator